MNADIAVVVMIYLAVTVVGLVVGLSMLAVALSFIPGASLLAGLLIRLVLGCTAKTVTWTARHLWGAVIHHPILTAAAAGLANRSHWFPLPWFRWVVAVLIGLGVVQFLDRHPLDDLRGDFDRTRRAIGRHLEAAGAFGDGLTRARHRIFGPDPADLTNLPPPPRPTPETLAEGERARRAATVANDPYTSGAELVDAGALAEAGRRDVAADPYATPTERAGGAIPLGPTTEDPS